MLIVKIQLLVNNICCVYLLSGLEKLAVHLKTGADCIPGARRKGLSEKRAKPNYVLLQRGLQQRCPENY